MNGEQLDRDREERGEGVRIIDKRRIDPVTGERRVTAEPPTPPPAAEPPLAPPTLGAEPAALELATARAEEAMADAKRIAAEYANYRKRVDRDREAQRDAAIGSVIAQLIPVLDVVDQAREHDALTGGFKAVADALEALTAKYGVERLGSAGEPFDPNVHEAMTSEHSDEVEEPTVKAVYQVGYRMGGRVLRAARVAVADNG